MSYSENLEVSQVPEFHFALLDVDSPLEEEEESEQLTKRRVKSTPSRTKQLE